MGCIWHVACRRLLISNGVCLQWGTITISGDKRVWITLPKAYTSINYQVVTCLQGKTSDVNYTSSIGTKNTTQFELACNNETAAWLAMGY